MIDLLCDLVTIGSCIFSRVARDMEGLTTYDASGQLFSSTGCNAEGRNVTILWSGNSTLNQVAG